MKHYIQTTLDTLSALNFQLDREDRKLRGDRWIFTHANAPEQPLRVGVKMSQAAASKVIRHAEAIVGLAHTETDRAEKAAKREAEAKRREAEQRAREAEDAKRRADAKERNVREAKARQYLGRQKRGALTRADRLYVLDHIQGEFIDVPRIADELCIREAAVRAAIDSGELDAYMCSGVIKCKLREVRAWVAQRKTAS